MAHKVITSIPKHKLDLFFNKLDLKVVPKILCVKGVPKKLEGQLRYTVVVVGKLTHTAVLGVTSTHNVVSGAGALKLI